MINDRIKLYYKSNFDLVKSLIIKSSFSATSVNKEVLQRHPSLVIDTLNPETWKYYLNLSGQRHSTDKVMEVVSLDTGDLIEFTHQNLELHKNTRRGYKLSSLHYNHLVKSYPQQEALILGALYPVDIKKAIEAEDGTILNYEKSLVEPQEYSLIEELEEYIKRIQARWWVGPYSITDPYYPAVYSSILSGMLVLELIRLRRERIKTNEVHSFHLREYLASHNALDRYYDYLTHEQIQYFYKNVKYLRNNPGKTYIFENLIDTILDKRGIPLVDLKIKLTTAEDGDKKPIPTVERDILTERSRPNQVDSISLDELYDKDKKLAFGTERALEIIEKPTTQSVQTLDSSSLRIKDLESTVVDLKDSLPVKHEDAIIQTWVYTVHEDLYGSLVRFTDPLTLEERELSAKEALTYFTYLTVEAASRDAAGNPLPLIVQPDGTTTPRIYLPEPITPEQEAKEISFTRDDKPVMKRFPPIPIWKFRKYPRPQPAELETLLGDHPMFHELREQIPKLLELQPLLNDLVSVDRFKEVSDLIYDEQVKHLFLLAQQGDPMLRGVLEQMIHYLFSATYFDLNPDIPLEQWLDKKHLPKYDYSLDQVQKLLAVILEAATGYKEDKKTSIAEIQKHLINLFTELSSYSIQVVREVNEDTLIPVGYPDIRVGPIQSEEDHETMFMNYVVREGTRINDVKGMGVSTTVYTSSFEHEVHYQDDDESEGYLQGQINVVEDPVTVYMEESILIIRDKPVHYGVRTYSKLGDKWVEDKPSETLNVNFDKALRLATFLGEISL